MRDQPLTVRTVWRRVLTPESDGYVSLCPELDIASQGESVDEALANLKEAVEGFYEAASPDEIVGRLCKPSTGLPSQRSP
ncbi:MAG: type II toxin-antitoxin system HicB family antitoxin [Blastochloris sp.]|nr:type II toxin-antitoxin system HicB family antitoxin [Blastochloris sp.]